MPVAPGTCLGRYEVLSPLGAGGMGEVCRARDARLGRAVAIKILRPEKVCDPERKRRFIQEAQAASALNHPNIITIHDIGLEAGVDFIAMEYVAGRTLADLIGRRGLPVPEALKYAVQLAGALAAAHAAGIVHRDLKPANVMVTENGLVKVLDFGLAKLMEPAPADDGATQAELQTREGTVTGTPAYMSPEQAQGRSVDARSDIFAFGAVLYQMITGRAPFQGDTSLSTLSAILREEPKPVGELAPGVPAELEKIILRCLRKDPDYRFQHMADLKVLLQELAQESSSAWPAAKPGTRDASSAAVSRRRLMSYGAVAAVVLTLAGVAQWSAFRKAVPGETLVRKFQIPIPGYVRDIGYSDSPVGPAISPDGRMVAYTQDGRLWIRSLSRLQPVEVPGTQDAAGPFWSPGSDLLAYAGKGVLKRVAAEGGSSSIICDLPGGEFLGGTWGTAGSIVFGISARGLYEVSAQGGEAKPLVMADRSKGEADFHSPCYLPDGRSLVYGVHPTGGYQHYLVARSGQRVWRLLSEAAGVASAPVYSPSGYLLYVRIRGGMSVYAVPFSPATLTATGEPFLVAEDAGKPSVSRDGTLLYVATRPEELVMVDRSGKIEKVLAGPYEQIRFPSFSPDGERVALMGVNDGNWDIWVHDVARETKVRLTSGPESDRQPAWSPSGDRVVFVSGSKTSVLAKASDGSGQAEPLLPGTGGTSPELSPDGRYLVYLAPSANGENDIWRVPLTGARQPVPFLQTPFDEINPKISPDSRHIAYASNESGRYEVYVKPFPDGQGQWAVSSNGGTLPRWRRDGREIFYVEGNSVIAVPVQTTPVFRLGQPKKLFSGDAAGIGLFSFAASVSAYDVSADGLHFAAVGRSGGAHESLTVVENWLAEFQRRN